MPEPLEISTAHLPQSDLDLFEHTDQSEDDLPGIALSRGECMGSWRIRMLSHSGVPNLFTDYDLRTWLLENGASLAFLEILRMAWSARHLEVSIGQDGPIITGLTRFDGG